MSIETDAIELLKKLEGTKQYQTKMKYFRNGMLNRHGFNRHLRVI